MKKLICILTLLCMIFAFGACSDSEKNDAPVSSDASSDSGAEQNEENGSGNSGMNFKIDEHDFDLSVTPVKPAKPADVKFDFVVEDFDTNMSENLTDSEVAKLGDFTDEERKAILEKKEALLTDIALSLADNNIDVTINGVSGEIIMDASILFDVDKSDVSDDGKDFLKKFIPAYAKVICDKKYDGFVGEIRVEGHTDTDGSYDYNKNLSEARAENVAEFCKSGEIDIADDVSTEFRKLIRPYGCSYDRPVKDSNGNVDKAASRRVTFRIMINLG